MTGRRAPSALYALLVAGTLLAWSCNGDSSSSPTPSQPSPQPSAPSPARLRIAQLSEDASVVDVAVNGEIRFAGLEFGAVSAYETLPAGDYRIQFVESGSLSPSIFDTIVSLAPGDSLTVGIAGFDSSDLLLLRDERAASSSRAGLRFANAVPDFPRELDLAVLNGPVIASRVGYLGSAGYQDLIPGLYDLELLRTGTRDSAAESYGHSLTAGRNFTAFAIGTLRRENIEVIVVSDSDP